MDKKITIKGKRTFDIINGVKPVRNSSKKWRLNKSLLDRKEQISNLNKLYFKFFDLIFCLKKSIDFKFFFLATFVPSHGDS